MQEHGADIVALNCGTGMDMERAREASNATSGVTDLPVMAQPNAGPAEAGRHEGRLRRDAGGDGERRRAAAGSGRNIIGGCCGSTPDHIRAFRNAMDAYLA